MTSQQQQLAELTNLYIYPVKSLPGVRVEKALVTPLGLVDPDNRRVADRKWMVVDENGSFRTQRQLPHMALISLSYTSTDLVLTYPEKGSLDVSLTPPKQKRIKCRVWGTDIDGYAYGGHVSEWLSDVLQQPGLDLVGFEKGEIEPRNMKKMNATSGTPSEQDEVVYADYSPFMMISEPSLDDLNSRLKKRVSMRNFRPNFVACGCLPYAEDEWSRFGIGDASFHRIKHCTRCLLTTVDPDTGEKDKQQEPLETLKSFRLKQDLYGVKPILGINFVYEGEEKSQRGDNHKDVIISIGDKIMTC